jgi:hypothetical protein
MLFVNLCFELAPEKKITGCQIWRTRRPLDITTQGDNMSSKHFSEKWKGTTRCTDHAMVYTENGTYTAVQRRAPHHCMCPPPEAMPLLNRGVLSAAPVYKLLIVEMWLKERSSSDITNTHRDISPPLWSDMSPLSFLNLLLYPNL